MPLTMPAFVMVLACLVAAGHSINVQKAAEGIQNSLYKQLKKEERVRIPKHMTAFARFLLMCSPIPAWQGTCEPHGCSLASKKQTGNHAASRSKVLRQSPEALAAAVRKEHSSPGLLRAPELGLRRSEVLMPSIAYSVPTASREDWIKSYSRLYPERICHLGQEIDDFVINQLISLMLFMDAEDPKSQQYLYINSPGGSVIAGLALYDTMQHITSPVLTANLGMAASMASFLLGAGVRGKRMALPGSWVMIHQPMAGVEAETTDKRVEAEQVYRIKETILDMYAEMTGKTRSQIEKDLAFDNYMPSEKAMEYGLIDAIAKI